MEINLSLGFISYLASGLLYLFLLAIYFVSSQKGRISKPFIGLLVATLLWSGLLTWSQVGASVAFAMITVAEILRYFTWFFILHTAAGYYLENNNRFSLSNPLTPKSVVVFFVLALVCLAANDYLVELFQLENPIAIQIGWLLGFATLGLLLVEQVFRNTPSANRGPVTLLCISAGAIFVYDFFVFSNAMLVQSIDYEFWSARGIANILVLPTLALAAVRNPQMAPDLHVSRKFVFHTTTLLAAGAYLLIMALVGLYVRESNSEWGKLIQTSFFFASLLLLLVVFFSPRIKIRIKRYLTYSFRNKYDYRDEWNRFSQTLLMPDPDVSLYQRAIQSIGQIVDSQGGSLWMKEGDQYVNKSSWNTSPGAQLTMNESASVIQMLHKRNALLTGSDLRKQLAKEQQQSPFEQSLADSWLILPLSINDELFGFVSLEPANVEFTLGIEDIDLLSTVAHHVALALFLKEADVQLQQAQRFKDLNQMTAFLVHDLKTVFSQLSLLVDNAQAHKSNPEFVDDMVSTVAHTTQKMQRLLEQLRNPEREITLTRFALTPLIEEIAGNYQRMPAGFQLSLEFAENPLVRGDRSQLFSAIKHIVQNGFEAVDKDGKVKITASNLNRHAVEVTIEDNGEGMTIEFIRDRLFKPFESTKGVSGMGVGVYQSREYIRSINGELDVTSEPGKGSCFKIILPVEYE